jgi:hypothetical protein
MGKTPMGQQVAGSVHPKRGYKINVGKALCHGSPQKGFVSQFFSGESFAHAGAYGNMRNGIHSYQLNLQVTTSAGT